VVNLPLYESVSAVFDAAGRAAVRIGPSKYGESWHVTLSTITTTSVLATSFRYYRQHETPSAQFDVSLYNGNNDVSDSTVDLAPMEQLMGVWAGGTPGRVATLIVQGQVHARGRNALS
jgi:hypothetical protein